MAGKMIVATGNRNKMIEIREILSDVDVEIVSMKAHCRKGLGGDGDCG